MKSLTRILCALMIFAGLSCSEDLQECPSKMCIMSGGWKLSMVFIDNVHDAQGIGAYRLILQEPTPSTATEAEYSRQYTNGTNEPGTWSIINNGSVLQLVPYGDAARMEDWIIEEFSPRKLILFIDRDTGIKDGPGSIRLVFEPL